MNESEIGSFEVPASDEDTSCKEKKLGNQTFSVKSENFFDNKDSIDIESVEFDNNEMKKSIKEIIKERVKTYITEIEAKIENNF